MAGVAKNIYGGFSDQVMLLAFCQVLNNNSLKPGQKSFKFLQTILSDGKRHGKTKL